MRRAVIIAGLVLAAPAAAAAQEALDEAARAEAAQAFDEGVAAFAAGELETARAAFERAYTVSGHTVVLFNLAETQRRLGRMVEAQASYSRLLERGDLDEPTRERAQRGLDEATAAVATLSVRIESLAPGDEVRVDGEHVEHDALTALRLDPGAHALEIVRAGAFARTEQVALAPGQQRELSVRVPALIVQTPPVTPDAPVVEDGDGPGPSFLDSWIHAMLGTLIGGAGGFALASAVVIPLCLQAPSQCGTVWGIAGIVTAAVVLPLGASLGNLLLGQLQGGRGRFDAAFGLAFVALLISAAVASVPAALTADFGWSFAAGVGVYAIVGALLSTSGYISTDRRRRAAAYAAPTPGGFTAGLAGTF